MDYNIIVLSGMIFLIVCALLGVVPALLYYVLKRNANA